MDSLQKRFRKLELDLHFNKTYWLHPSPRQLQLFAAVDHVIAQGNVGRALTPQRVNFLEPFTHLSEDKLVRAYILHGNSFLSPSTSVGIQVHFTNCPEIFPKHNDGHEFLGNGNVGQISLSTFCSKARGVRHDLLNAMGTIRYNNLAGVVHVQLTFNFGIPSPLTLLQTLHQILKGYHISGNLQAAKFVADLSFHSIDPFNFDSCALVFPRIVANPFDFQVLDEFDLVWYVHSSFMKLTNFLYQYPTPLGVTVLENSASSLNSLLCPCGSNNCPGFAFDQHELCSNHY